MGDTPTHMTAGKWVEAAPWLPSQAPVSFLPPNGNAGEADTARMPEGRGYIEPSAGSLLTAYRKMVLGRRFDAQATALTKQGRLAVYPSASARRPARSVPCSRCAPRTGCSPRTATRWRSSPAGIDPVEALTLLRGDAHCGYDPVRHAPRRSAPRWPPMPPTPPGLALRRASRARTRSRWRSSATARPARATSMRRSIWRRCSRRRWCSWCRTTGTPSRSRWPGSARHRAWRTRASGTASAPSRSTATTPLAVLAVLAAAVEHARAGRWAVPRRGAHLPGGPHTNADDASRYRDAAEADRWRERDPIARLEADLRARGVLADADVEDRRRRGRGVRRRRARPDYHRTGLGPRSLFDHVFGARPHTWSISARCCGPSWPER